RTALREAAGLAALHLIQHRSGEDLDRRRRSEALRTLLDGRGTVAWAAGELGVPARSESVVVALVPSGSTGVEAAVRAQRTADLVALHCETYRRAAACVSIGATVYVLLPGGSAEDQRVRTLVETLVHRVHQALRVGVRAGISAVHPGLAAAATARREADQAVRALEGDPRGRLVAAIDDVRARVVLRELADHAERVPELTAGPLQALAALDRERGTAYVPTLRAYLDPFGDMSAAAARVNVHPNTFRYRVRRIAELSGINLEDPDERVVVELQLRFLESGAC
ncbi:MAG: PucR family transcriptional regulator, partial [Mycobacteriales bacterium]